MKEKRFSQLEYEYAKGARHRAKGAMLLNSGRLERIKD